MKRDPETFTIKDLAEEFPTIEFPEYQREPTVWSRDQKQRLMDSILRQFDIAAIYLYEREDSGWECIDGRQRLNAIMSFLGENPTDPDDGFSLKIDNEVTEGGAHPLAHLDGLPFAKLERDEREAVLDYEVIVVVLSGSHEPAEFNLQFLRLNLGTLINAGEKLNAMVGVMRDLLFDSDRLGKHPFLEAVKVPTRRFARELIAAQIMLEVSSKRSKTGDFTRARHFDLQRYLKEYSDRPDPHVDEVIETMDALHERAPGLSANLGNRAICVSVVLAAWELEVRTNPSLAARYGEFVELFLHRLKDQVERMKKFDIDRRYGYLVTFQRHLTQAAVEKPAIRDRHAILIREFERWDETGQMTGDDLPPEEDDGESAG